MSSIQAEYHRLLTSLAHQNANEDLQRVAHLVWRNLEHLSDVGTARRARSNRLTPILQRDLVNVPIELPDANEMGAANQGFSRLRQLKVGPFRGFMSEEIFDLSRDITLVYGANGTGKSSFCEALETTMLGSINEARAKRVDHQTYCNNARLGRHRQPSLSAINEHAQEDDLQPSEEQNRFCFIEKNRLDDFARIAARTPGDQRQLIATLFGVDQFNEFARGFNTSLDDNLDLVGQKNQELTQKRTLLSSAERIIAQNPERLQAISQEEVTAANKINQGSSFEEVKKWALGDSEHQGRLSTLVESLEGPAPTVFNIYRADLEAPKDEVYRLYAELSRLGEELRRRSGEVSYKQLYDAVLQLNELSPDACPACGTDLGVVVSNPFDKARNGLSNLRELAELQSQEQELRQSYDAAYQTLFTNMRTAMGAIEAAVPPEQRVLPLPPLPAANEGNWFQAWVDNDNQAWTELLRLADFVAGLDENSRRVNDERTAMSAERRLLEGFQLDVARIDTLRSTAEREFQQARETVDRFEADNRELIADANNERPKVEYNWRIKRAYDGFLAALNEHLSQLPQQLLQGLGQLARDLYNSFNRQDPEGDLLHALWLPLSVNSKIELEFIGEPGVRYDALVILSEGHIKCLGLAILLAKNLTQGCPVVIFDDVVNAIDDDHRDGILRTFFEDGHLDHKQVILTSHAEEFLHRIQQRIGAERAGEVMRYKFFPHEGEHELCVNSVTAPKNYVLLAQQSIDEDEKRDALKNSRTALESLTDQIWTWMGRRGNGVLELKLSGPRARWELNNKCTKIRSVLNRHPDRESEEIRSVIQSLDVLLGFGQSSMAWAYLNGGTHDSERDGEFDRELVTEVVNAVVQIDSALESLRRP